MRMQYHVNEFPKTMCWLIRFTSVETYCWKQLVSRSATRSNQTANFFFIRKSILRNITHSQSWTLIQIETSKDCNKSKAFRCCLLVVGIFASPNHRRAVKAEHRQADSWKARSKQRAFNSCYGL